VGGFLTVGTGTLHMMVIIHESIGNAR
jgi:hypothetical protein